MASLKTRISHWMFILFMMIPPGVYLFIFFRIDDVLWTRGEAEGALHVFRVLSGWEIIFAPAIFIACLLSTLMFLVFIFRHILVIAMIIACISYLAISLWVDSKSFGFVEKTGIRYSYIDTNFKYEKIEWKEIAKQAALEITVRDGKSSTFGGILKLKTDNGQLLPFNIRFDLRDEREHQSLINVLNLLKENNIRVKVIVWDSTSGDKRRDKTIDMIRNLTDGKPYN